MFVQKVNNKPLLHNTLPDLVQVRKLRAILSITYRIVALNSGSIFNCACIFTASEEELDSSMNNGAVEACIQESNTKIYNTLFIIYCPRSEASYNATELTF